MTPYYDEDGITIYHADCREVLPSLKADVLAVATGHGRDAIGIDLDDRNYELALDRVGPLVLTRAEAAA